MAPCSAAKRASCISASKGRKSAQLGLLTEQDHLWHKFESPASIRKAPVLRADDGALLQESGLLEGQSYTGRALTEGDTVKRRYVGQFLLHNGLEVYLRSFNVFNLTLWDDTMAQFGELTEQDILVRRASLPFSAD